MSKSNLGLGLVVAGAAVAVFVVLTCTYVIHEREQAVIIRLNRPVGVIVGSRSGSDLAELRSLIIEASRRVEDALDKGEEIWVKQGAGLYFKLPFVDTVRRLPDVLLEYDAEPREIVVADKKKLVLDNFARWYIENPLLYLVRLQGSERNARDRLDDIIYSAMRNVLGKNELIEVIRTTNRFIDETSNELTEEENNEISFIAANPMEERIETGREKIMKQVAEEADEKSRTEYGIRVVDVRIKRADLPPENLQAVFDRMEAERSRISKGYRSEGRKEADIIEGRVNKRVDVIRAEGQRDAEKLRGEGEAKAFETYAKAFGSDPELYRFLRTLEIIQDSTPPGSELVIGLDSSVYKLLQTEEVFPD
jgi:modulator of FtsH protease HflC